jgi:hypothetical protein
MIARGRRNFARDHHEAGISRASRKNVNRLARAVPRSLLKTSWLQRQELQIRHARRLSHER